MPQATTIEDVIKYQQENQALLKTIMYRLQQNTSNPDLASSQDLDMYKNFLKEIEDVFEANKKLGF